MRSLASILPARASALGYSAGGRPLLRDISFELTSPGRSVILGPNGAGKSLLLRLLHGLLRPTAGRIDWAVPWAQARSRQAMVFQRPVMLRRTALGNVRYALKRRLGPAGGTRQEALGILEAFGLSGRAGTAARLLSGGEQQRLALARAWALRPELLLLDEPCAALDPAATRAVELAIAEFAVAGSKIVLTTHDLGQARRLGNDVLFLAHGRLVERGPAEAFFSQPQSEAARRFLAGELLAVETGDASC